MNLGERIYRLRTEKNLSQGDLAEMLDVSRQSISKWENNSAVPDLEKIIKLSEIFSVSLDELVKGEKESISKSTQESVMETQKQESGFPLRKIAGTILLCMGFLVTLLVFAMGGFLSGLIFASPFLVCGIICFVCKENVGLWCGWGVYFCVYAYLRCTMGITPGIIRYTRDWTADLKYVRLVTGLGMIIVVLALLIGLTVVRLRRKPMTVDRNSRNKLIVLWVMFVAICIFGIGLSYAYSRYLTYILPDLFLYSWVTILLEWLRIIVFTCALVHTVRFCRSNHKREHSLKFEE